MPNIQLAYIFVVIITCLCEGSHFVLFPTELSNLYGKDVGALMYSFIYVGFTVGSCKNKIL